MSVMKRLLMGLCLASLVACATNTRITNSWRDTDYAAGRFQRVLVLGFGEDGANRRVFEDNFVMALQAAGVPAVASYTLVSGLAELDLPRIKAAVARAGADAVLTTRLVGVDRRVNVYSPQPVFVPTFGYRRGFSGYYASAVMMPPSVYNYEIVTLETNLWQSVGERLVWSGTTENFAPDDARQAAAELAEVIVKALRGQGLM